MTLQEAREHFSMLLEVGAAVAGSPAAEQLEQHVKQYLQVMPPIFNSHSLRSARH